jgi:DNA-binding response OmpR family regulator
MASDVQKQKKIDIILLDLMLPYKSGDEIVKELRLVFKCSIIIISAKDMVQT